jgi:glycerophosphoryl diester phosphodiesterase
MCPETVTTSPAARGTPGRRPRLIAHRGAPTRAPEHTIAAYETAVGEGVDALELDVRLSADDQLVVIHDARLERTTNGRGPVRAHTAQALKRLDAGGWFGVRFRGQRIQTLMEVIERFRDRAGFVVRLPSPVDAEPGIEERLVSLLQIYEVLDRTLVAATEGEALARCRRLDPDVGAALVVAAVRAAPALTAGERAVILPAAGTAADDIAALAAAGLECYVGLVDEPAEARRFVRSGVTGIVTRRPDLVRPLLEGLPSTDPEPTP